MKRNIEPFRAIDIDQQNAKNIMLFLTHPAWVTAIFTMQNTQVYAWQGSTEDTFMRLGFQLDESVHRDR
jgi:hypothetical protein